MNKSYLSPSDRLRINKELKGIRAMRRAPADIPEGEPRVFKPREFEINDGNLAAREALLKNVLEKDSPPIVDGIRKNAAYREFKTLLNEFESNSLTKYEQGLGYPGVMSKMGPDAEMAFERSKGKIMAWECGSRGKAVCGRLKELAGVIEPDNPELRNLENFRRRK